MSTEQLTMFEGAAPGPGPHPASRWPDQLTRELTALAKERRRESEMLFCSIRGCCCGCDCLFCLEDE